MESKSDTTDPLTHLVNKCLLGVQDSWLFPGASKSALPLLAFCRLPGRPLSTKRSIGGGRQEAPSIGGVKVSSSTSTETGGRGRGSREDESAREYNGEKKPVLCLYQTSQAQDCWETRGAPEPIDLRGPSWVGGTLFNEGRAIGRA